MTSVESNSESRRIEDYLRGRLNDEETRQFEMRMLEDDDLFAKVQREDLLRQGMAEQPHEASKPEPKPWWRGGGDTIALTRWLQPALTGALALSVIALAIGNLDLRQQIDQMQAPTPGIPVITLHDQRSVLPGTEAQADELGGIDGPVLLEIDVSAYEETEFTVEIQTVRDTHIYERVRADVRGYLTVFLPISTVAVSVYGFANKKILHEFSNKEGKHSNERDR